MSGAAKARLKVTAMATAMLALGFILVFLSWTDAAALVRNWGSARVNFGAGLLAAPGLSLFAFAIAGILFRSLIEAKAPNTYMNGRMRYVVAIAVGSILFAAIGGLVVAERLSADGYTRCSGLGYQGRYSSGDWVKAGVSCER